jgi:hypothetical protein
MVSPLLTKIVFKQDHLKRSKREKDVNQNTIFSSEGRNSSVVFSCVFNVISKFVLFLCCVHIFIVANNVLHVCPVSFSRFFLDCLFNVQYMYTRNQHKGCQSDVSIVLHVYVRVKSMQHATHKHQNRGCWKIWIHQKQMGQMKYLHVY